MMFFKRCSSFDIQYVSICFPVCSSGHLTSSSSTRALPYGASRNFNQEFSTRKLHSTSSMNFHGIGYIQQWWPNSEKHLPNRLLQSLDSNVCSNVCFNIPSNFWPKRHFVGAIAQKAPIIEDSKLVLFDNFECFEYLPGTWYADRISHEFNKKESKKAFRQVSKNESKFLVGL